MNTSKLKTFAQQARRILISGVEQRMLYWGFDEKGNISEEPKAIAGGIIHRGIIIDDPEGLHKWRSLKKAVVSNGFKIIVEEAAYTWFNRIMAIKILSENGFEQPQVDYGKDRVEIPEILRKARAGQYSFLDKNSEERLKQILNDYDREYHAFALLLEGYCHHNSLLLRVFGLLNDFTGLLIPSNILDKNGFIHFLNCTDSITEDDYKNVELIGWLYQFYISEKKDDVFKKFKNNQKAEAEDIPAATQIFTPNWIVKYMVENTVGQLWLDLHPNSPLKDKMVYRVELAEENPPSEPIITEVAHLRLLDPAVGSGHILVEGFDLMYNMYIEEYYAAEEAVESILKHNLFGLDIDKRATQLAQFAVLLKAAQKFPAIIEKDILPNIYAMPEPKEFSRQEVLDFLDNDGISYEEKLSDALRLMTDARNLGSTMIFNLPDGCVEYLKKRSKYIANKKDKDLIEESLWIKIEPFVQIIVILSSKYEAVAANPPYMTGDNYNSKLSLYTRNNYDKSCGDLMTVFIDIGIDKLVKKGYMGMITLHSWMFIDEYINFRYWLINNSTIKSLIHFGRGVFGSDFGSVSFAFQKESNISNVGKFYKLFKSGSISKINDLLELRNRFLDQNKIYNSSQSKFLQLQKYQICPVLSEEIIKLFKIQRLDNFGRFCRGIGTSDNERFLRYWFEISVKKFSYDQINKNLKWFKYNKGGEFRKWYGNQDFAINWEHDGYEIRNFKNKRGKLKSRPQNIEYNFKQNISYTSLTISATSARYYPVGFINDQAGNFLSLEDTGKLFYILGFINSPVSKFIMENKNPTINILIDDINSLPLIFRNGELVIQKVNSLIEYSKQEWDIHELSWNFRTFPLINNKTTIRIAFSSYSQNFAKVLFEVHYLEEEINNSFIEIYGLQNELTPAVAFKDITILQDELDRNKLEELGPIYREKGKDAIELPIKKDVVIQQFISYAIGCMMGRYRLDKPGLHIAYPNPTTDEICSYQYNGRDFSIDDDAIIPIMGSCCPFSDDVVIRFKQFLEVVWGADTLTENINFAEECLNKDIENYIVNDFWCNHCKMYSRRPIYWLFSSNNGAFQVLAYMHRMNKFTAEKVRNNYLLKHIQFLKGQINLLEPRQADLSKLEIRKLDKFRLSLMECEEYDLVLKDVADKQIEFDLDDGVKVNYAKFGKVLAEIK